MNAIKYPYNRLQIIGFFCAFLPFMIISAKELTGDLQKGEVVLWLAYVLIDAVLFGLLVWIITKLIPGVKHGAALELDDEKFYYAIENKTVYWKDVTGVTNCKR